MSRTEEESGGKSRAAELLPPPLLLGRAKKDNAQNPGTSQLWAPSQKQTEEVSPLSSRREISPPGLEPHTQP